MPEKSVNNYFTITEYGKGNTRPVFIFGGWLTRPFYYSRLIKQLLRYDFHCVLYIPRRKLIAIGTDYRHVVMAARLAVADMQQRLAKYDGDQAAVFGFSFGTAFAMEASKQCTQVKQLVLIAPAGDFEKHVELWQKQPYFKRIVAAQPTNPAESGKILNQVGMLKRLDSLKDKEILIGYIKNDRVMHVAVAKELVEHLRTASINPTVLEVKGGHNSGLLRYVFNKTYIGFLLHSPTSNDKQKLVRTAGTAEKA